MTVSPRSEQPLARLEECVVQLIRDDMVPVPAYPAIATLVVKTLRAPNYTMQELIKILSQDNAVCAALLRYANAGVFGGKTPVATLPAAVGRLGANEVARIAIATTLGAESAASGPLVELRRKAWRESVINAHIASLLAPLRDLDPDDMFMAGLLHDFGKVLTIRAFEIALRRVDTANVLDAGSWNELVERYHVELGMVLAVRWALPAQLAEVIARHHTYNINGDYADAVAFMQVIDSVVRVLEDEGTVDPALLAKTGLSPHESAMVVELLPHLATQVASFATPSTEPSAPAVRPTPADLGTPKRDVNLDAKVTCAGSQSPEPVGITCLGPNGMLCVSRSRLITNQLARIAVSMADGETLDLWVTVLSPVATGETFTHELKPFAMPADVRSRYLRYVYEAKTSSEAAALTTDVPIC